jgi:hypothetical protein
VVSTLTTGDILTTPPSSEIDTTPVTLAVSQVVGGLIWMPSGSNNAVTLPSASDFKTYFGNTLVEGLTFSCDFYRNSTATTTFTLGASTSLIDRGNTTFTFGATSSPVIAALKLTYQYSLGDWSIYQFPRVS